jgi:hypothetical protein
MGKASRMRGLAVNLTGFRSSTTVVIQVDQIRPTDLNARNARPKNEKVPDYIIGDILDRFAAILGFEDAE